MYPHISDLYSNLILIVLTIGAIDIITKYHEKIENP